MFLAILFTITFSICVFAAPAAEEQHSPSQRVADNPLQNLSIIQARVHIDSLNAANSIAKASDEFSDLTTAQPGGVSKAADILQTSPFGCLNGTTTTNLLAQLVETKRTDVIDRILASLDPMNTRDTLRISLGVIVKKYADTLSAYGKDVADPVRNSPYIFRALASDPAYSKLLPFASAVVRSGRDFAFAAVQTLVSNLQIIPSTCGFYRELVEYAVGLSASALRYVTDKTFEGYGDVALKAVNANWTMLWYVPETTPNYLAICLAAVNHAPLALQCVDPDFKDFLQVALIAVRQNGLALAFAGPYADSMDVIHAAIAQNPTAYLYASARIKKDPDFWIDVFIHDYNAWKDIPGDIKASEYFQLQLVQNNLNFYSAIYELGAYKPASDSVKQKAQAMRQAFALLRIYHYQDWFNCHREILRNRHSVSAPDMKSLLDSLLGADYFKQATPDSRPLCLMIYADDPEYTSADEIEPITTSIGYRVLFYDASTDVEYRDDFLEATIHAGAKASLFLTGGHGTELVLRLGLDGSDYLHANERYVDVTDSSLVCLRNGMHRDGRIIMHACNNGHYVNGNTSAIDNLAEFFHYVWPQAYVHAGNLAISNILMTLDTAGLFSGVQFRELPTGAEPGYYDAGLTIPPEDISESIEEIQSDAFVLSVYPNPFSNAGASISFTLQQPATISFRIFDEKGVCLERSSERNEPPGNHEFHLNGRRYPAGDYYVVMQAGGKVAATKFVKLR